MDMNTINSFHLDVLKEIGNIGAAHAATALSNLLETKIDMHVPAVEFATFDEMVERCGGAENVVAGTFLQIEGDLQGNMFFVLPVQNANKFIGELIHNPIFDIQQAAPEDLGFSAMQELGNILSGSYLSALSDFTKLKVYPTAPALSVDMFGAIISIGLIELSQISDHVIVIDTKIFDERMADGEEISGHFFLMPNPESFQPMFEALGITL